MKTRSMVINAAVSQTRAVLSAFIALASLPILLAQLGPQDFGLYNLIGGVIGLLAFMRNALSSSSQRHISLAIGADDAPRLRVVLANSMAVHLGLSACIALVGSLVGLWYIEYGLNATETQREAALFVWGMLLLTVIFNMISVPFFGILLALERMVVVSVLEIVTSVGALLAAVALHLFDGQKIVWYACLVAIANGLVTLGAIVVSLRVDPRLRGVGISLIQRSLIHELLGFAGWSLFGTLATAGRLQGMAVVLNRFFGTEANAAFGIASRLGAFHITLTSSIQRATYPRIMREEGANQRARSLQLAEAVGRCAFLVSCLWCIPFIAEADFLLSRWLPAAPRDAVIMTSILLAALTIDTATIGLSGLVQAIGRIARYQIVVGIAILMAVPLAVLGFGWGASPSFALWSTLIATIVAGYLRAYLSVSISGLDIKVWFRRTVLRGAMASLIPALIAILVTRVLDPGWLRLFVNCAATAIATAVALLIVGLESNERTALIEFFMRYRKRLSRKQEAI